MLNYISSILLTNGFSLGNANMLANIILLLFVLIICIISEVMTNKVILKNLAIYVKNTKSIWDDIFFGRKVFNRLSDLVPPLIFYIFIPTFSNGFHAITKKIISIYIIIIVLLIISSLLNAVNDIYNTYPISKTKPIKGLIQVVQIIAYLLGAIIIISNILDTSPMIILSGVGALTAVFLIVFKDSLLGLVSGIQITTNDMLRIGDWIEMPKYDANGEVLDISLNTIKIENFDKTITNIPSYAFISDSFKNWRNMQESGGRRIKRSIHIDTSSIQFCDEEMLEKFKKIRYLSGYIAYKQKEIAEYNLAHHLEPNFSIVRRLTNIGTFREYIQQYLNNHPSIHKEMIRTVRQLEPGIYGVPLEIYAFTKGTDWLNYEKIQADIFDHILSVASQFDIRIFQSPSGHDIKTALQKNIIKGNIV